MNNRACVFVHGPLFWVAFHTHVGTHVHTHVHTHPRTHPPNPFTPQTQTHTHTHTDTQTHRHTDTHTPMDCICFGFVSIHFVLVRLRTNNIESDMLILQLRRITQSAADATILFKIIRHMDAMTQCNRRSMLENYQNTEST